MLPWKSDRTLPASPALRLVLAGVVIVALALAAHPSLAGKVDDVAGVTASLSGVETLKLGKDKLRDRPVETSARIGAAVFTASGLDEGRDWAFAYSPDDVRERKGDVRIDGELQSFASSRHVIALVDELEDFLSLREGRTIALDVLELERKSRIELEDKLREVELRHTVELVVEESGGGESWRAKAVLRVEGDASPRPKARKDLFEGVPANGVRIPLAVLTNDRAPKGGGELEVACFRRPSRGGALEIDPAGENLLYTPAEGFSGVERFSYVARTEAGAQTEANVEVEVAVPATRSRTRADLAVANTDSTERVAARATDIPADETTESRVEVGVPKSFPLRRFTQEDWHRVYLRKGVDYRVQVELRGENISFFPRLLLFDVYGVGGSHELLDPNWDGDRFAELDYRPPRSEDHFIGIEMDSFQSATTCSNGCNYRITVTVVDDYPGTFSTRGRTGGTFPLSAAIERSGDSDWFQISMTGGEQYTFRVEGSGSGNANLRNPGLRLRNAGGGTLRSAVSGNGGEPEIVYTPSSSGTHYVEVYSANSGETGSYLLISEGGNIPSDSSTWAELPLSRPVSGLRVNSRDLDWYRVELERGKSYRLRLEGSATGAGTLPTPRAGLADAQGYILRFDGENDGTSEIRFTAAESGPHFAIASGERSGSFGTYRIQLDEIAAPKSKEDWTADGAETNGRLGSYLGLVDRIEGKKDEDWFEVNLRPGEATSFVLSPDRTLGRSLKRAKLELVDADGRLLGKGKRAGRGARLRTEEGGIAYVVVSGGGGETGGYRLHVEGGDPTSTANTWATLRVGSRKRGLVYRVNDVDWYKVRVEAGRRVRFEVAGLDSGVGSLSNPGVTVRSEDGEDILGSDSDSGPGLEASLDFAPAADGVVLVSAYNEDRSTGSYEIRAIDLETPGLCFEDGF